jgi:hypothetical protein
LILFSKNIAILFGEVKYILQVPRKATCMINSFYKVISGKIKRKKMGRDSKYSTCEIQAYLQMQASFSFSVSNNLWTRYQAPMVNKQSLLHWHVRELFRDFANSVSLSCDYSCFLLPPNQNTSEHFLFGDNT